MRNVPKWQSKFTKIVQPSHIANTPIKFTQLKWSTIPPAPGTEIPITHLERRTSGEGTRTFVRINFDFAKLLLNQFVPRQSKRKGPSI
ncbi:hypothetical protein CEXT_371231 [Caerostris extrusa]|uniref:Ribosomal protein S19 n=1 Tax=Caerostris extrusa TaxID=172846 RepID=A0AAV4SVL6_CAEEX|nr:hypothetical protein CEXT_371231 [Caerostris extrusa]